jgi:MscS family membrane protein
MAMLALARRMFKIAVAVAAGILLLERAGVNVTALLAGLGVGSIAVALAARKTLENVFGGLALIMSEAARVGDVCKIVDQIGTVEDIGLATTRIRTFDRTLVSVPNANLSQATLENFAMRDKNWFHQLFGLRYDTSADQLRTILAGIEEILRGDPIVESSTARVRFMGFGPSSLNLEIFAYVLEPDYAAFLRSQQRLLLAILKVIEDAGAVIASPVLVADPANKGGAGTAKVSAAPAGDDWA